MFNIIFVIIIICVLTLIIFLFTFYNSYFKLSFNTKRTLISKNIIDSDTPFYKYRVITSHNSFVRGLQIFDASSTNAIKRALYAGARVIELDIHPSSGDKNIPVVSHAAKIFGKLIYFTSQIPLEECVDTINEFTKLTSDPIVIFLQLETDDNPILQANIGNIFKNKLTNKLLPPEYKLSKKSFFLEPIKKLLHKVIIITGMSSNQIAGMEDIVDCTLYINQDIINNDNDSALLIDNVDKPRLSRVYFKGSIFSELSINFHPEDYWKKHHQFVAMNVQRNGSVLTDYLTEFKDTSFLLMT
jgi:hypothetical protein